MASTIEDWFDHQDDAGSQGDTREEMHLNRVAHHKTAIAERVPLLMFFALLTVVLAVIEGSVESAGLLVIGFCFGAVLISILHHVRKSRFHARCAKPPDPESGTEQMRAA